MKLSSRAERLMGTTITVSVVSSQADLLLDEAFQLLRELEHRFNANSSNSELMAVNRQAGWAAVTVHPDLLELTALGREHSLAKNSSLNIAIGPLVDAWRIGFADARLPQPTAIKDALALTDPQLIEIDADRSSLYLAQKGMKIDLGALAKGYSADRTAQFLRQAGVTSALINLGGNILTIGCNEAKGQAPWSIGLQDPRQPRGNYLLALPIVGRSVVTSGIYERFLETDGRRYHHILDRRTGYPIKSSLASITVISDRSLDGEIWTSRLFGQPPRSILAQVNALDGIEAILVDREGRIALSDGCRTLLSQSD